MSAHIFKAYDIRGAYPKEMNEELAERIGNGAAKYFGTPTIIVARDHRTSSPTLRDALIKGVTDAGVNVIDIGLATTPMAYFASHHFQSPVAMITASHNPPGDNGIKLCNVNAVAVGLGSGLEIIRDLALGETPSPKVIRGSVTQETLTEAYVSFIHKQAPKLNDNHRIAIDTASAMGVLDLEVLASFAPQIELVDRLYGTFDGTCPHEANPMKVETLKELGESVRTHGLELGIGFDGDADRIGVVDEQGNFVRADHLTALIGEALLASHPKSTILADVRSSRAVKEHLGSLGGKVLECPVGHAKIKHMMRTTGAIFAGELSSHFYFGSPFMAEMGVLPVLFLLSVLEQKRLPLSQIIASLPAYVQSGENNYVVQNIPELIEKIRATFSDGTISETDGLKIDYPDWWFSFRISNTEPVVRLNVEARDHETLAQKTEKIETIIAPHVRKVPH